VRAVLQKEKKKNLKHDENRNTILSVKQLGARLLTLALAL